MLRQNSTDPQRGGALTQSRLADLIGERLGTDGWPRFQTVSDWERARKRLDAYADRNVLVAILQVLFDCGGLPGGDAANVWLDSGGYAPLSAQEIQQIFPQGANQSADIYARWVARLEAPTYTRLFGVAHAVAQLTDLLIAPHAPWILALEGLGGLGKTALTDYLARQLMHAGHFADLAWVSARPASFSLDGAVQPAPHPVLSVDEAERELAAQLLGRETASQLVSSQARQQMLLERLRTAPHLLVIDNLESLADLEQLLPLVQRFANPAKFLLTSRQRLPGASAIYHFSLPGLEEADALALIRYEAATGNLPHVAAANDAQLRRLFQVVGGNPLALRLAVGQLHLRELTPLIDEWQQATSSEIEAFYTFIYRSAWDRLDEKCRYAFLSMPLAVEQGGRLAHLVATSGLSEREMIAALDQLITLNLVNAHGSLDARRFSIHSLTRSFLHKQVAQWWV
ncbi:MAG: hypothetical protein KF753_09620 [Caldilineaceae bacterium]|nr:hypothetical protein [Caldilineaceae bacterium]